MKGRRVVIVPDNDPEGLDHAQRVASSLHEHAAEVRVLSLQSSVPPKGDVSDYLAASGTAEDLVSLADACVTHQPPVEAAPLEPSENGDRPWPIKSTNIQGADAVHAALSERGFFVHDGETAYYFDRERRKLIPIDEEHRQWRVLASVAFSINTKDSFFGWLTEDLKVKAEESGQDAVLATFAHYDPRSSTVLFDMGGGQVLKVGPDSIAKRDNGADGVLFRTMRGCDPWEYVPDAPELCTYYTLVVPANFEEVDQSVEEQRVLLFLWMLAMAFESDTRVLPIALAVGPVASGKSSLFRYIGQFLYGRDFQVTTTIQRRRPGRGRLLGHHGKRPLRRLRQRRSGQPVDARRPCPDGHRNPAHASPAPHNRRGLHPEDQSLSGDDLEDPAVDPEAEGRSLQVPDLPPGPDRAHEV